MWSRHTFVRVIIVMLVFYGLDRWYILTVLSPFLVMLFRWRFFLLDFVFLFFLNLLDGLLALGQDIFFFLEILILVQALPKFLHPALIEKIVIFGVILDCFTFMLFLFFLFRSNLLANLVFVLLLLVF